MTSMARVTVVIPTLDRPAPLAACLAALAPDFPADAETVVVADGGDVDLGPVVAPFEAPLRLRLIAARHGGPAAARNRGLEAARGEIVAFTDDDCRPRPGWLAALSARVLGAPPRAAGGTTRNGLAGNAYAEAAQFVLEALSLHDRAASGLERFLPSNNFAFPAEPLRLLGGFDESYRTAEDRELCRRWLGAGFELTRAPTAVVEHDARLDLVGFVRKFAAYGRGAARFHGTGGSPGLRESAAFHLHLPALAARELARRGLRRGATLAALLLIWELANVGGFLAEAVRRGERSRGGAVTPARARAR